MNSRLDSLQAAILGAKLPHLDTDNARRATIGTHYGEGLSGLPIDLPATGDERVHVYHLYVIACDKRDALMGHLRRHDVGCGVHYPVPVHLHRGYAERVRVPKAGLPITEHLVRRIVSLPIYPELGPAEVDSVIAAIHNFYRA